MINDIFKMFGGQTAEILFEIITECMDDYLYIFDLQNNAFEIPQSAVKRFNMSKNLLTDAANEVMKFVFLSVSYNTCELLRWVSALSTIPTNCSAASQLPHF